MKTRPFARRKHLLEDQALYSGEGPLHAHLRALGITSTTFYELVGIAESTFNRWYGYPLHPWPIEFLRWYGYAKGMEAKLRDLGYDTEQFRPKLPTKLRHEGRYPRTNEQHPLRQIDPAKARDWSPWKS